MSYITLQILSKFSLKKSRYITNILETFTTPDLLSLCLKISLA